MKVLKAIAKDDLNAHPHTWTKGLDYEWIDNEDYFTLASNEGSINYLNKVREAVAIEFELIEEV
ncbi:hypothetical protein D3C87_766510 [compost metagenome]